MGSKQSKPSEGTETVMKYVRAKETGIVIFVIAIMLLIVFIVIYVVSQIKKSKLQNVNLQKESAMIPLDNRNSVPYLVKAEKMSLVTNGQEFSYSFWIYLGAQYSTTANPKLLVVRGNDNAYVGTTLFVSPNANPAIFLDSASNTLYVAVNTSAVTTPMTPAQIIKRSANGQYNSGWLVTRVTYVPLQRWVQIVAVVSNASLNVYMDGDLYSVATISDIAGFSSNIPIIKGTSGNMIIGDNVNYTSGHIAKTSFFNYAMSQRDIKINYNTGPSEGSFLSYFGLGNYALRSPVYSTDSN